jgi:hypothetical protein
VQHLFLSHSHQDRDWVDQLDIELQRRLQRPGQIWIDKRNIPPTIQWQMEVRDAIEGAAALVACESASFHASENCRYEMEYARRFGTRIVPVRVGDDPGAAADYILDVLVTYDEHGLTIADVARADRMELRRLARAWHQLGRPRRALVGRWHRRRLKRSLRQPPPAEQFELDFLRASLMRARRRTVVAVAAVLIAVCGGGSFLWYAARNPAVGNANLLQASAYHEQRLHLQAVDADPYTGLALAATRTDNESFTDASVIAAALGYAVPDDAFTVDRGRTGLRFAQCFVTRDVILVDSAGDGWRRTATATDVRAATRVSVPPDTTGSGSPPWPAELSVEQVTAGVVDVYNSGTLWRTIRFGAPVVAPQISPNGRFLAAAGGSGVQVADLGTGRVRFTLRGAPGALTDLAWSADSARLWGTAANGAVAWTLADATTLRDDPSAAYSAILPSTDPHRWWLVDRHGLILIDEADGRTIESRTVPDELARGAGAPDGSVRNPSWRPPWPRPPPSTGAAMRSRPPTPTVLWFSTPPAPSSPSSRWAPRSASSGTWSPRPRATCSWPPPPAWSSGCPSATVTSPTRRSPLSRTSGWSEP